MKYNRNNWYDKYNKKYLFVKFYLGLVIRDNIVFLNVICLLSILSWKFNVFMLFYIISYKWINFIYFCVNVKKGFVIIFKIIY